MKILIAVTLFVSLIGLSVMEYFHHSQHHGAHDDAAVDHGDHVGQGSHVTPPPTTSKAKVEEARELYRQHMRDHQY
jgi:hypothetical protein